MISDNLLMAIGLAIDGGIPDLTNDELMNVCKTFGINKSRMENELKIMINPLIKREEHAVRNEVENANR